MENKIKQLRKGILELAILGSLNQEKHYGYSLIKAVAGDIDISIAEGTIYPILNRLANEGLIRPEWVESKQGPPRKYYALTDKGKLAFDMLNMEFQKLAEMVANANRPPRSSSRKTEQKVLDVKKETSNGRIK